MKRKALLLMLIITPFLWAKTPPFLPNVSQGFTFDLSKSDPIEFVFNNQSTAAFTNQQVTMSFQNREWDYQWIVAGWAMPTQYGSIGLGYSYYGNNGLPKTSQDRIGAYISGQESDTMHQFSFAFQPTLWDGLRWTVSLHGVLRQLIDQSATSVYVNSTLSSPHILNNQAGIQFINMAGTPYKWKQGQSINLPQYIGVYVIYPFTPFYAAFDYHHCINYPGISVFKAQLSFNIDTAIRVFLSTAFSDITAFSYGMDIRLSDALRLRYASQSENRSNQTDSYNTVSIGVTF